VITIGTVAATDGDLITATVRDYFEGWFEGDAVRMDRALHPDLVKRDAGELELVTKPQMVEATAGGVGVERAAGRRIDIDVEVADVRGDAASVVVRTAIYHEYLHLARTTDGWRIVNALWQFS
jgi:ketosteroid isomerase-like protein